MKAQESGKVKEGLALLGHVHFQPLDPGRVRCVETGHEMPESEKASYDQSKKCRLALFDQALAQRRSPLNFFQRSPVARDKVICTLTGDVVNKSEKAVWKHMNGKKFQRKLAEKETEKEKGQKRQGDGSKQQCQMHEVETKGDGRNFCSYDALANNAENEIGALANNAENESIDSDFWIPPVGDRWDYDNGNDRWEITMMHGNCSRKKRQTSIDVSEGEAMSRSDTGNEDDDPDDDNNDMTIRTKRMSLGAPCSNSSEQKKKRRNA